VRLRARGLDAGGFFAVLLWLIRATAITALAASASNAVIGWPERSLCGMGCHQIPSRCFWFAGAPFALCARCTGLHLGVLLCLIVFRPSFRILLFALLAVGLDALAKGIGYQEPASVRFFSGLLLGASLDGSCRYAPVLIWWAQCLAQAEGSSPAAKSGRMLRAVRPGGRTRAYLRRT